MVNRQRTTARRTPTLLTSAQIEELRTALAGPAPHGERWTCRTVAEWMSERLGRPVPKQRGWDYLQRLQARPLQPRPHHVQADPAEQEAFKKGSVRSSVKSLTPSPTPTSNAGPPTSTASGSSRS
jgi:transposase